MQFSFIAVLAKPGACVRVFPRSILDICVFVLTLPLTLFQIKDFKVKKRRRNGASEISSLNVYLVNEKPEARRA